MKIKKFDVRPYGGQCWLLLPALIMSWKKVTMVRELLTR